MESKLQNNKKYAPLKEQKIKPKFNHLMHLFGVRSPFQQFLNKPEAQGIITPTTLQSFQTTKQTKKNSKLWLQFTIDSWLSTCYQFIWIERCKQLKLTQSILTTSQPHNSPPNRRRKVTLNLNPPPHNEDLHRITLTTIPASTNNIINQKPPLSTRLISTGKKRKAIPSIYTSAINNLLSEPFQILHQDPAQNTNHKRPRVTVIVDGQVIKHILTPTARRSRATVIANRQVIKNLTPHKTRRPKISRPICPKFISNPRNTDNLNSPTKRSFIELPDTPLDSLFLPQPKKRRKPPDSEMGSENHSKEAVRSNKVIITNLGREPRVEADTAPARDKDEMDSNSDKEDLEG